MGWTELPIRILFLYYIVNIKEALGRSHRSILTVTIFGLIVGISGAVLLARHIKKLGLEPHCHYKNPRGTQHHASVCS